MTSFYRLSQYSFIWFFIVSLFLLQVHIDNSGGTGRNLPQTAIAWGIMSLFSLAVLWRTRQSSIVITPVSIGISVSTILLWIPWFFTHSAWLTEALWPLLGLFAGMVFYLCLLQITWTPSRVQCVLLWIVFAALLQTILVLWQQTWPETLSTWLTYPKDQMMRSGGVFQQVNLLSSFTATGLAAALLLYLKAEFNPLPVSLRSMYQYGLMASLVLFPVLLVIQQSRIGWLGGGTVALLLLLTNLRQTPRQTMVALTLLVSGTILGVLYLRHSFSTPMTHDGSNHARIVMLRETLNMILSRPWQGWGYGGFEYSFQHFRLAHGYSTLGLGVVTHPHNEYLYRWAEGGMTALLGMLLFSLCGLWLFLKAFRRDTCDYRDDYSFCLGQGFCLLPLLMHTQTEYPFYLSALHWGVFIMLLALWDKQLTRLKELISFSFTRSLISRTGLAIVMFATLLFTATGGYSGWLLWRFEHQQFEGEIPNWKINPWLLSERAMFDSQVASLLAFNHDRDPFRLNYYSVWAQKYSTVHIDREVYARLVQILRAKGDAPQLTHWETEAYALFPDDSRFRPRAIPGDKYL